MKTKIIALCCALILVVSIPITVEAVGPAGVFNCTNCGKMTEHSWHYHNEYFCILFCNVCHNTSVYDSHFYEVNGAYLVCKYCYHSYMYGPEMPNQITADELMEIAEGAKAKGYEDLAKASEIIAKARLEICEENQQSQDEIDSLTKKCAPDNCGCAIGNPQSSTQQLSTFTEAVPIITKNAPAGYKNCIFCGTTTHFTWEEIDDEMHVTRCDECGRRDAGSVGEHSFQPNGSYMVCSRCMYAIFIKKAADTSL